MAARSWGFDGDFKNTEAFHHVAFRLWSRYLETRSATSISLVPHYGNVGEIMLCIYGGDSVLDLNMKQCREQPLRLFLFSLSLFC